MTIVGLRIIFQRFQPTNITMKILPTNIQFFSTPSKLRAWFKKYHSKEKEVWVGFYKTFTGKPSITWSQSVDEAICFGWIDGIRKSIDDESYTIRFTPRNPKSIWSAVNIKKVEELSKLGLMQPAGLKVFNVGDKKKSKLYSYEQEAAALTPEYEKIFQKSGKAWKYFSSQAPGYRKVASWWVISAKKEETQLKRLETLITDSEAERKIAALSYSKK